MNLKMILSLMKNNCLLVSLTKSVICYDPQVAHFFTKNPQGMVHLILIISLIQSSISVRQSFLILMMSTFSLFRNLKVLLI